VRTMIELLVCLSFAAAFVPARAQSPEEETSPPRPEKPKPMQIRPPQDDTQREMIELFGKVERELRAIDKLLQEAARAPSSGSASSLAEELRTAQTAGEAVRKDIDRILELAASQQQQSSSGSSSQQPGPPQPGQSGSPLDSQGEQSTSREQTPSTPEPGGAEPKPGEGKPEQPGEKPGEKPGGQKPDGQGRERPDGPQGSKDDPRQNPSGDPAAGARGAANPTRDGRDRWGDLPVHAREVFRNEGGKDMPPLYRDWIDAYYKRLNKTP